MTWNFRIVRYRDGQRFGLHEVYYDEVGKPSSMTAQPVGFACDVEEGPEGIRASLARALDAASTRPVLDEPEVWAKEAANIQVKSR